MKPNAVIKPSISWNAWALPALFLLILIIEKQAFGTFYTSWLYGLILVFFGILYSARYRMYQPAVLFCLAGITLWHYVLAAHAESAIPLLRMFGIHHIAGPDDHPFSMATWIINLLVFLVLLPLLGPPVVKAYRLEQSAKQLFRLASMPVSTAREGFTNRPFYAGNPGFTKEQFTGFATFLSINMIAFPIFTENSIVLTFSMGKSPLTARDPLEVSYILFDESGSLSVHISGSDYHKFKSRLTFDRLCESTGSLFMRFLEYYAGNKEARILSELKAS